MTCSEHCSVAECPRSVAASIDGAALCRNHFISSCYARLDRYEEVRQKNGLSVSDAEDARRFIHDCTRQADEMEHEAKDLDNLERAKLLHIMLTASELGRFLRRSPRKVASIAVRLSSEKLGGAWQETTETVLVSQYGASVRCSHTAKVGETLHIERADTGQTAVAKVAWQRTVGNDDIRLGVEFVGCENFWGLDWSLIEETG
jgi:hypothetical protein